MCSANTTHEVGITNDQTHFLLAFGLTAKLKFLPQKSDFPSHEPEFEVPRSVYILI